LGVAINCDQIIRQQVLDVCKRGILNVHASKLPEDPGISPVLWSFARGDQVIWSSVYKMDRGLDTGPIIEQVPFAVEPGETAFRLYERICQGSGARLSQIIEQFSRGDVAYRPQQRSSAAKYLSWPDRTHYRLMRQNGRRFISCADLVRAFATERTPG
jgi:methionyl-tRNA formyltransferase